MSQPFQVVVLAAGAGTRMRSRTPKGLIDLCGRPLALWPLVAALEAGADPAVVVDGPSRPLAEALPPGVRLAIQEQTNGSGGALAAALPQLEGDRPVVVLCGDVPLIEAAVIEGLLAEHAARRAAATVLTAKLADPSGYGRIVRDGEGLVARIVETKRPGDATQDELEIDEVNAGVYVFEPRPLGAVLGELDANNAQGELYLTQAVALLRARGLAVAAWLSDDERVCLGVNDRSQLAVVRGLARAQINQRHLQAGVDLVDPATTVIDVGVAIEADARIEPFTQLLGRTRVGGGARVGPFATVVSSEIAAGATVRASWLEQATVGELAQVGPYAYLRPGTVVGKAAKAGTFVELKATELGPEAKVPHLSYVGDAKVGARANLGAATITANFDGFAKHPTTIGEDARLGVDTTLVAPVEVGARAYTAAGSVITEGVPPGALGVARSRQRNIAGYADRREREAAEKDRSCGVDPPLARERGGG